MLNLNLKFTNQDSEINSTFSQLTQTLQTMNQDVSIRYIEHISYLSTLLNFEKVIEFGYLSISFSLILLNFHQTESIQDQLIPSHIESIKKLHNFLVKFSLKKTKLSATISKKIQSSILKFLNSYNSLITESKDLYTSPIYYKICILSMIMNQFSETPFALSLVAFMNVIKFPLTSLLFPAYTNTSIPYLPMYSHKAYTLVLDLDETLIHKKNNEYLIRPGAVEFLEKLKNHYEIVLFTAASPMHADAAMKIIDPFGHIKLRLYNRHITFDEGVILKDINLLGRDLDKTIIVDNLSGNFRNLPKNGICIETWTGDENDTKLYKLALELEKIPYLSKDVQDSIAILNKLY